MYYSDDIACCCLNKVFGFNPLAGKRIMDRLERPSDLFSMNDAERRRFAGMVLLAGLDKRGFDECAEELERLARTGCRFVGLHGLPALLKDCSDPPLGLYVRSSSPPEEVFRPRPSVAVVGTRDVSRYGLQWCRKLTGAIAQSPARPVIVSGLAIGVDIAAHLEAIDMAGSTIAVLPTGLDKIYPYRHEAYADRICNSPGSALVSDYPPGTMALKSNFLRRNRIIAGLSQAVLLIESKIHGGGMMTARLAASYNRAVYALPGRADDIRSAGCNKLISDQTAELVASEGDLLAKLGLPPSPGNRSWRDPAAVFAGKLPPAEIPRLSSILGIISGSRGIGIDDISVQTMLPVGTVRALVSLLESEGFIQSDIMGRCHLLS